MRKNFVLFFCFLWAGCAIAVFGSEALQVIVPSDFDAFARKTGLSEKSDFENTVSTLKVDAATLNAGLQIASREWSVLPVNVKKALHPLFYPPMPNARYAKENYEIFFEPGNAEDIAQLALVVDGAREVLDKWLPPAESSVKIILTPFPPNALLAGYTIPTQNNPTVVLNSSLPRDEIRRELLFQLCFARMYSATTQIENPWLYAASAPFLHEKLDGENYVKRMPTPTAETFSKSVFGYSLTRPADPSFLFYLDETFSNKNLFTAIWENAISVSGVSLKNLMSAVIKERTGYALKELFPRFALWTLSRGERNNGTMFRDGARWRDVAFYENVKNLPAWISDKGDLLELYGVQYIRLAEAQIADADGIKISFDGSAFAKWAVGVAIFSDGEEEWLAVNLADGRGNLLIPHKEGREIIVAVGLTETLSGTAPAYSLNIEEISDYPVKISNAVSRATDNSQVRIEWTSAREENVFGWRIRRADITGIKTLVTQTPVISPGYSESAMHYVFMDRVTKPGAYNYELQVITRDGLTKEFSLGSVAIERPTAPSPSLRRNLFGK